MKEEEKEGASLFLDFDPSESFFGSLSNPIRGGLFGGPKKIDRDIPYLGHFEIR